MGLIQFLRSLFFGSGPQSAGTASRQYSDQWNAGSSSANQNSSTPTATAPPETVRTRPKLVPLRRHKKGRNRQLISGERGLKTAPYQLAVPDVTSPGTFLDLSRDGDSARRADWELPELTTPQDLADWLEIPLGHLGWLTGRYLDGKRPLDASKAHYHYTWKQKRKGGFRLIEAPYPLLRQVQEQILDEILCCVPTHVSAHGFKTGCSVLTNAQPHLGKDVVVKLDLDNFYTRVRYSRVVALFRGIGYNREIAIWLARLTTSAIPGNLRFPGGQPKLMSLFLPRHLPQGAPTSPALANLVAYSLDIRLNGIAESFGAQYTRYGDDLTFSGDHKFRASLRLFLPLVRQIIRHERFVLNPKKMQVVRPCSRQLVTGVVVNQKPNISRKEFDRLKATLHNCVRLGPESQNRTNHENFRAHLRGRIAFVQQLNPARAEKLLTIYNRIKWS